MSVYRVLSFKMKLAYQARVEQTSVVDLFFKALQKTLADLRTLSVYKLQKITAIHNIKPTIKNVSLDK